MSQLSPQYPITVDLEAQLTGRNRVTTLFRAILAIPHLFLVGGLAVGIGAGGWRTGGALATAAFSMAIISWFAVVFTGSLPQGLWDFVAYFMRWRVRAVAYLMLLRDDYPPFGDLPYPVTYEVGFPSAPRDRLSVGLRLIYVIPHLVVLIGVNIAWMITTIISWFAIVFTGKYPQGLYHFGVGAMRWNVRVESYALLLRDEYPPFRLEP
ncbi:MAG: DUF4389 domain-containing protein [Acidimicrobiales bacterium]